MSEIRAAVVGVGSLGQHHARVYASLPGCRLGGVYDVDPSLTAAAGRDRSHRLYGRAAAAATAARARNGGT